MRRWTRWRTRRGYAAHRVQIHGAETLEERTLLSGLSAMRPDVTLDGSVDPPYYQGATWSARDNAADTPRSIRQDAADDATDEFRWTGWHSSDLQGRSLTPRVRIPSSGSPTLKVGPTTPPECRGSVKTSGRVAGEPQPPVRESAVLLPQGTQIAEVRFDLGAGIELTFRDCVQTARLEPLPKEPLTEEFGFDGASTTTSFPGSAGGQFASHVMCGYPFGMLYLFPVQYDGTSQVLTYSLLDLGHRFGRRHDRRCQHRIPDVASDVERVAMMVDNDSLLGDYRVGLNAAPESGVLPARD